MKIAVITSVRNEAGYIKTAIRCMLAQTVPPARWVIVDDGSSDGTGAIIGEKLAGVPFVRYVVLPDRGYRKPAVGVVESFYRGREEIADLDYDVIAKLDGDLEFPSDMIAKISEAFREDPRLGITGGCQYEGGEEKESRRRIRHPRGFVSGIAKFYRRECFEEIGGIILRAGWDGVDTVRAGMKGWRTGQLEDLKIYHLRTTGTARGEGIKKAGLKYGDVSFYMGGYFWYFLLHVMRLMILYRSLAVGFWTMAGFFKSLASREPRETKEFRRYLKRRQLQNLFLCGGKLTGP